MHLYAQLRLRNVGVRGQLFAQSENLALVVKPLPCNDRRQQIVHEPDVECRERVVPQPHDDHQHTVAVASLAQDVERTPVSFLRSAVVHLLAHEAAGEARRVDVGAVFHVDARLARGDAVQGHPTRRHACQVNVLHHLVLASI